MRTLAPFSENFLRARNGAIKKALEVFRKRRQSAHPGSQFKNELAKLHV